MKIKLLIACIITFNLCSNAQTIYLGALETHLQKPNNTKNDTLERSIRILFYSQKGKWYSLSNQINNPQLYPNKKHWYIGYDYTNIGEVNSVKTKTPYPESRWTFPRDVKHVITTGKLPRPGKPSILYGNWARMIGYVPYVVVSKNTLNKFIVNPKERSPLDGSPWQPTLTRKTMDPALFSFYAKNIEVVSEKSQILEKYTSAEGTLYKIGLQLKNLEKNKVYIYPQWVFENVNGELTNLNRAINKPFIDEFEDDDESQITLIANGDYNKDGKTDLLFKTNRYNGDGYVLFSDLFRSVSHFNWSYH